MRLWLLNELFAFGRRHHGRPAPIVSCLLDASSRRGHKLVYANVFHMNSKISLQCDKVLCALPSVSFQAQTLTDILPQARLAAAAVKYNSYPLNLSRVRCCQRRKVRIIWWHNELYKMPPWRSEGPSRIDLHRLPTKSTSLTMRCSAILAFPAFATLAIAATVQQRQDLCPAGYVGT